jgi:NhaA family Na+:H+ antiporter
MPHKRPTKLDPAVDLSRDHWLGEENSELTLVEYGNYARESCHAAHEVVAALRDRFGSRMRYVFRHRPAGEKNNAHRAAELAEFAHLTTGKFWPVHDALMKQGPDFTTDDFEKIANQFNLPSRDGENAPVYAVAKARVQEDVQSAKRSGVLITPTFFINGRRYEGPWDENTLAEAMLGTLGHRLHAATVDFIRWAPSAGFLLLAMSILAVGLANSPLGSAFAALWITPLGVRVGNGDFTLPLLKWTNDGLLAIFFLFVGLEIKREFTVGRLSTLRSGALPVIAAFGGIALPIVIYLLIAPPGPMAAGWGVPIATDTAFAVAIMVLLGARVSVELRIFLTAAVIIDDLVAIGVIAIFYTEAINPNYLIASVLVTGLLVAFNRSGIYGPLPYAVLGVVLWVSLHEAGVHATLAGVILALVTPTLPPPNFRALLAQAEAILQAESKRAGEALMRHGPSEPALRALDAIHGRMESPADKLLRSIEPWSSFCVLPIFALANAGVILSLDVFHGHSRLMLAIILGLVVGKPLGIFLASWLAVRFRIAVKPNEYSWRQLAGAGALGGIGFTMSLFIAGQAFPDVADFAAAKIAIFIASIVAGVIGTLILLPKQKEALEPVAGSLR